MPTTRARGAALLGPDELENSRPIKRIRIDGVLYERYSDAANAARTARDTRITTAAAVAQALVNAQAAQAAIDAAAAQAARDAAAAQITRNQAAIQAAIDRAAARTLEAGGPDQEDNNDPDPDNPADPSDGQGDVDFDPEDDPPGTPEERYQQALQDVGATNNSHQKLLDYLREYSEHPTGIMSKRILAMIQAMVTMFGVGDLWENLSVLPMGVFLTHWPLLQHPFVNVNGQPDVNWLDNARELLALGATTGQLRRLVRLYEEFKAFETPVDILVQAVDLIDQSVEVYLTQVTYQLWTLASQRVNSYVQDVASRFRLRLLLVGRRFDATITWGSPIESMWDILWQHAIAAFNTRQVSDVERLEFDLLFDGAYRAAHLSRKYWFPPDITPTMSARDICDLIETTRTMSVAATVAEWRRGNPAIRLESSVAFNERRRRFLRATSSNGYRGWGWYIRDEALRKETIEESLAVYRSRFQAAEPTLDRDVVRIGHELHRLKTRLRLEVLVPYWPQDMAAADYIVSKLKPEMFAEAIRINVPLWQTAFIDAATGPGGNVFEPGEVHMRDAYDEMLANARNGSNYPWGPVYTRMRFAWDALLENPPGPPPFDLANIGRIEQLRDAALKSQWDYGDAGIFPMPVIPDQTLPAYCALLAPAVWQALQTECYNAWNAEINNAVGATRTTLQADFNSMKIYFTENGTYYRPDEGQPPEVPRPLEARVLGPGNSTALGAGDWGFVGTAGTGTSGHAGVWALRGDDNQLLQRIVIKETYMSSTWDMPKHWHMGRELRVPKEFKTVQDLNGLPDANNIIRYYAYGIYERLRMHRIYMELCPLGTLRDLLIRHLQLQQTNALDDSWRIPVRAMWAIFESLVTALHLMQIGPLPGRPRQAITPIIHRDIKPANTFLSPPDNLTGFWPGIPVIKMGDYGAAIALDHTEAQRLDVGTPGYKAPEHIRYDRPSVNANGAHGHTVSGASDVWAVGRVMHSLMNLQRGMLLPPHNFDSELPLPEYLDGTFDYYPRELTVLVEACLVKDPTLRTSIERLYRDVHFEVASYVGLGDPPMKSLPRAAAEGLIDVKPDAYLAFAADLP